MRCEEPCSDEVGVEPTHAGCVPVAFADNVELARQLQSILERCHIPAFIDSQRELEDYTTLGRGVGVFVPDQMHDRASDILAEEADDVCVMDGTDDDDDDEDEDDLLDDDEEEDLDDLDDLDDDYHDDDDDDDDDDADLGLDDED